MKEKQRFMVLDIFRGLFSSMVVFYHMSGLSQTIILNNSFILNADLFVDFFFVLSGFVIAYTYTSIATKTELTRFFKKRFFRLYPLHLVILLIFTAIELPKHFLSHYVHVNKVDNAANSVTTFFTNLFLVNSVKTPGVHDVSWNIASWSISAEMIAYLAFGLITIYINRNTLTRFKNLFYAAIIIGSFAVLFMATGAGRLTYTFDYGFLRSLIGFFTGVICFNLYNNSGAVIGRANKILFDVLEPALILTIITVVTFGTALKLYGFIYEVLFFGTVLIFAFEKGWVSSLLKKPVVLHQMGKYSYSIYMVHTLLLSLFNVLFIRLLKFPPSAYTYLFIPNYILIYWVSAWTYKNIEMRFNRPQRR